MIFYSDLPSATTSQQQKIHFLRIFFFLNVTYVSYVRFGNQINIFCRCFSHLWCCSIIWWY